MRKTGSRESEVDPHSAASVYDQIVRSVAGHLRQQGFSSVRANIDGFTQPANVSWDEEDEGVVPDITGEHSGCVYVFEIETRDHIDPENVEDRWRLLSVYAKRHHGKFYLVIPETKAGYLEKFVKNLGVQSEFLKLTGIE